MYQCSYVYSISQCGIYAAWVCVLAVAVIEHGEQVVKAAGQKAMRLGVTQGGILGSRQAKRWVLRRHQYAVRFRTVRE